MSITRLYTGSDGQSHLEALDPATHPELTTLPPRGSSSGRRRRAISPTGTMPPAGSTSSP